MAYAKIRSQVLATDANIGYLVMELDRDVSGDVMQAMSAADVDQDAVRILIG